MKLHFMSSLSRNEDGRYAVRLPWVGDDVDIPDNRETASQRLKVMTRKLEKANLLEKYDEVIHSVLG